MWDTDAAAFNKILSFLCFFSRSMLITTLKRRSRGLWRSRASPASMRPRNMFTCWWKEILTPDSSTRMPTWVWSTNPRLVGTFKYQNSFSNLNTQKFASIVREYLFIKDKVFKNIKREKDKGSVGGGKRYVYVGRKEYCWYFSILIDLSKFSVVWNVVLTKSLELRCRIVWYMLNKWFLICWMKITCFFYAHFTKSWLLQHLLKHVIRGVVLTRHS